MTQGTTTPEIGIGLLGYGTVGAAVHRLLTERADDVERVAGRPVRVVRALVRDARPGRAPDGLLTTRPEDLLEDPSIGIVAELMGGLEPAREHVLTLLRRGTPVVTANKQLLARHGSELFAAAEQAGTQLRFEAAVCGAIPVVRVLRESLVAAAVREVTGIVNGTTNFILTAMAREGSSYGDALRRAQELGYAEADPTDDVSGGDAAAKLAILSSIAFHAHVELDDVPHEGIDRLEPEDLARAAELGYAVKLLARATLGPEGLGARVAPTLVPHDHPLARVDGGTNAVLLRGDAIREITLQGPGAGGEETATAVIGDLLGVIGTRGTGFLEHDGYYRSLPMADPEQTESGFYVRLEVEDRPGVLAQVARSFGDHGVSLGTVLQRASEGGTAEIVLLTHPAREGAAFAALRDLAALSTGRGTPRALRVLAAT